MRMRHGRPFVRLKSGASLDGRAALANGESKWITSEEARADVQHWRAQSGAVLTSAATVLADDPRLDVRIDAPRQPLRVVLDRRRRAAQDGAHSRAAGRCAGVRRADGDAQGRSRATNAWAMRASSACASSARISIWRRCSRAWRSSKSTTCWWKRGPRLVGRAVRRGPGRRMAAVRRAEIIGQGRETGGVARATHEARGRAGVRAARFEGRGPGPAPAVAAEAQGQEIDVHGHRAGDRRDPAHRSAHGQRAPPKIAASKCRSRPSRASGSNLGDSICVDGVCLTVAALGAASFHADVSGETLRVTTLGAKPAGARVNLEPALRAGDSLGGHWVSGHVDGIAEVLATANDARSLRVEFAAPQAAGALHRAQGFGHARWREPHRQRGGRRKVHRQSHSAHARSHHARRARRGCARQSRNRPAGSLRRAAITENK